MLPFSWGKISRKTAPLIPKRVFHFSLALFFVKALTRMGFTLLNRVPLGKFNRVKVDVAGYLQKIVER